MIISCVKCGRPCADIQPPTVNGPVAAMLKRTMTGLLGLGESEVGQVVEVIANPTADAIQKQFNVQCADRATCAFRQRAEGR